MVCALGISGCVNAPPNMKVTPVVTGLSHVWDIGFTPDGTMLYTERPGRISAFVGGQKRLLVAPPDVVQISEAGVMGMAIDPQFATNRYIFVCMVSTLPVGGNDVRLIRWKVNATYTGVTERTDIVTGAPVNLQSAELGRHSGCRPRFGLGGALYVGTGDAALASAPQDPHSLGGKVLRIDRNGNGWPGNPGGALDPRIYSYGHRNVQGIAFRTDGLGISAEHGPDRDDEINRLVTANFGWNPHNPSGGTGYYESVSMTDRAKFPNAVGAIASSGIPTYAPSGATFITGSQWGEWNGALVVATLKGGMLRTFKISSTGALQDRGHALAWYGRLRSVTQGPGGFVYVGTSNGGDRTRSCVSRPTRALGHRDPRAAHVHPLTLEGHPLASSSRR